MGKSKKRTIAKAKFDKMPIFITRSKAINSVCEQLRDNPSCHDARKTISLFGLSAEELSESGVSYEILRSMDGFIM